eukprot:3285499-Rhodomonas_salina.2
MVGTHGQLCCCSAGCSARLICTENRLRALLHEMILHRRPRGVKNRCSKQTMSRRHNAKSKHRKDIKQEHSTCRLPSYSAVLALNRDILPLQLGVGPRWSGRNGLSQSLLRSH